MSRKYVIGDTHAGTRRRGAPIRGARVRPRKPPRGPVEKPDWPRVGDLVSLEWTPDRIIEGVVIDVRDRGWDSPMLTVLDHRGGTVMCTSPSVRVISRRKKPRGTRRK